MSGLFLLMNEKDIWDFDCSHILYLQYVITFLPIIRPVWPSLFFVVIQTHPGKYRIFLMFTTGEPGRKRSKHPTEVCIFYHDQEFP